MAQYCYHRKKSSQNHKPFNFFLHKYSINNAWYYHFKYKISTTLQYAAILWALDYKNSRFPKYEYPSWFQWPACSNYQPMMTSSNGNIFRVTGPLCGESTGPGEFPTQRPVTRSFDVFFDMRLNKRLSKQPWGWWFETPSWLLRGHCNVCLESESVSKRVS